MEHPCARDPIPCKVTEGGGTSPPRLWPWAAGQALADPGGQFGDHMLPLSWPVQVLSWVAFTTSWLSGVSCCPQ